ncbi:hypothetical protein [Halobacillus sp. B29]|uniref:hypothetical protein n=1 Tax=Halobacillus sp. B29 TaxID=3457432 RepID=UPI003FCE9996
MDYISLLSGIIGTVIGGLITWLNTRYNLNRQFEEQRQRIQQQERKAELIALNAVEKELQYNLIKLRQIKEVMQSLDINFFSYGDSGYQMDLKMNKWEKHSDIIEMMEDLPAMTKLQAFYINISTDIATQAITLERIDDLIKIGLEPRENLKSYIAPLKKGEA